jgi:hypothetical protein
MIQYCIKAQHCCASLDTGYSQFVAQACLCTSQLVDYASLAISVAAEPLEHTV